MAGGIVVSPVEQDPKNVLEVARNHRPVMTENHVKEQRGKSNCATGNPALVSNRKVPLVLAILLIPPLPPPPTLLHAVPLTSMEAGLLARIDNMQQNL